MIVRVIHTAVGITRNRGKQAREKQPAKSLRYILAPVLIAGCRARSSSTSSSARLRSAQRSESAKSVAGDDCDDAQGSQPGEWIHFCRKRTLCTMSSFITRSTYTAEQLDRWQADWNRYFVRFGMEIRPMRTRSVAATAVFEHAKTAAILWPHDLLRGRSSLVLYVRA